MKIKLQSSGKKKTKNQNTTNFHVSFSSHFGLLLFVSLPLAHLLYICHFPFHRIIVLFVIHTLNCSHMYSLHKRSAGLSSMNKGPAAALCP